MLATEVERLTVSNRRQGLFFVDRHSTDWVSCHAGIVLLIQLPIVSLKARCDGRGGHQNQLTHASQIGIGTQPTAEEGRRSEVGTLAIILIHRTGASGRG